jgi:hypothetical protein
MPELVDLLKRIEELRKILNDLGSKKALNDPEIVGASQMLDGLLNEYQKLLEKKKEHS